MTMHCIKCGSALPAETATCPTCGASTPYNVTTSSADISDKAQNTGVEKTPSFSSIPQEESQPSSDWHEYQSSPEQQAPPSSASEPATFEPQLSQATLSSSAAQSLPIAADSVGAGVGRSSEGKQASVQPRDAPLARPLLLILLALVVIVGSGLLYTVFVGRPAEFHAQATAIAQSILTPTSPQDVYTNATSGKPDINDPLSHPRGSSWSESGASGNGCTFSGGGYHLSMSGSNFIMQCFSKTSSLSDFAFQVQITITQGSAGGLTFRVDNTQSSFYNFTITPNGFYELDLVSGNSLVKILNYGPSSAINSGLNQHNLLTVVARGSNIYLYANKQYLATVSDATYRSGSIGLFAIKGNTISGDVTFSNAQVWKL